MATVDQIKALIKSHVDRDDERFLALVLQVAAGGALHAARRPERGLANGLEQRFALNRDNLFGKTP